MTHPPQSPLQLPLAFGNERARVDHDPDQLAELVSRAVPLRDLSPRHPSKPFVHRAFHVQAATLGITAAAHSPLHGANFAGSKAVFTLPTAGEKRFLIDGQIHRARAGYCALFLPGEAYSLETTACSGVMFSLCPKELAAVASTMAGPECSESFAPINRPIELLENHPQQGRMLALMRRSLQLIDLAILNGPCVPKQLGLDDKLQRLMALLIYPQLSSPPVSGQISLDKRHTDSFEALLEEMRKDLHGDWTLTRMERQAALSRLELHQLFQSAFGCGPMEWLRHQRLCWARLQLEDKPSVSVNVLAFQCGYHDLKLFRRDFENLFLTTPESFQPNTDF
jgi:AraC-like DNA-binding protein